MSPDGHLVQSSIPHTWLVLICLLQLSSYNDDLLVFLPGTLQKASDFISPLGINLHSPPAPAESRGCWELPCGPVSFHLGLSCDPKGVSSSRQREGHAKPSLEKHCLMTSLLGLICWTKKCLFFNIMQHALRIWKREKNIMKFLKTCNAVPQPGDNHS